jgi:hypothetical protein
MREPPVKICERCNIAIPKELGLAVPHIYTAFDIPGFVRFPLRCGAGNRRQPKFFGQR